VILTSVVLTWSLTFIAFGAFTNDLDTGGDTFQVRNHPTRIAEDAIKVVTAETEFRPENSGEVLVERSLPVWALTVMFAIPKDKETREREGNILVSDRVEEMHKVHEAIYDHPGYQEDHCVLVSKSNRTCDPSTDALRTSTCECQKAISFDQFFYDAAGNLQDVDQTLATLCGDPNTALVTNSLVSKDFDCANPSERESVVTRMTVFFGAPLRGYKNKDDEFDEQEAEFTKWITSEQDGETLEEKLNAFRDEYKDNMEIVWLGSGITEAEFDRIVVQDASFAFGAILAVAIYVGFHTRSFFLTVVGMLHILVSFGTGHFIMRVIVGVEKFNLLNTLSIFIILGIGADDIFIFLDAWKQAGKFTSDTKDATGHAHRTRYELEKQMEAAHKRATFAMLVTSLTTAFAFFANVVSLIPPIRMFGLFTGLIVIINFLLVVTQFPSVVVFYEQVFAPFSYKELLFKCMCCARCCDSNAVSDTDVKMKKTGDDSDSFEESSDGEAGEKKITDLSGQNKITADNIDEFRWLERMFFQRYSPAINKGKIFIMIGFALLAILAIVGATQLKAADEPARFLPDDYPVQVLLDLERDVFKQSEFVSQVQLCFGLDKLDVEGIDENDPDDRGTAIYNDDLIEALKSKAGQDFFFSTCDKVRALPSVRASSVTGQPEVLCWLDDMLLYLNTTVLPVGAAFETALADFSLNYDYPKATTTSLFDQVPRGFTDALRFDTDRNLKFTNIIANLTVDSNGAAAVLQPVYDEWEEFVEELKDDDAMPDGLKINVFQTSDRWPKMATEAQLLGTAIIGIIASIVISSVIVSIFTRNLILTPLMILSVAGIVVTMLGLVFVMGWTLGIIESICITILTGLSIDYVVHLGIAINESFESGRYERVRAGLTTMGISVLSASLTTILASTLLLFTTVLFFVRFGIFLLLTIVTATFWSFVFFIAASFAFAPQEKGDATFKRGFMWCKAKVSKKE
jgi:hypothetical protein